MKRQGRKQNSKSRQRANPRPADGRAVVVADVIDPPPIPSVTRFTRKYRFNCTGNLGVTVTCSNLLGIAGAMCTVANNTLTYISFAARLHSVEVWAPAATNGVVVQTEIQMYDMNQGPAREIANVAMSPSRPSYTKVVPHVGEWGYQVFSAGSTPVFGISCPTGSIIDVNITHYLADLAGANTTQAATAATLGQLYYTALDGTTKTAVPIGLPMAA